jgi:hypothetical protein
MADEKTQELDIQTLSELQSVAEEANMTDIKIQMLALAKDVLERNAALQWEQDKTRGLTITVDEIIGQAQKLINFVVG